jgi:uncharacterized protein
MNHGSFVIASGPVPADAGIGLRLPHHRWVLEHAPAAAWLEVHPENYMRHGAYEVELELIRRDHPLSLHAVGLSLGSTDGVSRAHLRRVAALIGRYEPALISDHLSWSAIDGVHFPDLLPLPYTEEALCVVATNVDSVQSDLKRQILIENPSSYLQIEESSLTEPEFLGELVRRCECEVLLDVNNICVSAHNRGEDPRVLLSSFLHYLPAKSIGEIHLAGHATVALEQEGADLRIDDHGSRVSDEVWQLYAQAVCALGSRPTLIEWDKNLPEFSTLRAEADKAQEVRQRALSEAADATVG